MDYKFKPKIETIQRSKSENQIHRGSSIEIVVSNEGEDFYPAKGKRWFESGSTDTVNLGSSMKIFSEEEKLANLRKSHSKLRIFDFGRRASLMKLNLMQRRNTVA